MINIDYIQKLSAERDLNGNLVIGWLLLFLLLLCALSIFHFGLCTWKCSIPRATLRGGKVLPVQPFLSCSQTVCDGAAFNGENWENSTINNSRQSHSFHQSLMSSSPMTTLKWTGTEASIIQWFRGINPGTINKINLLMLNSQLCRFRSWWGPCIKIRVVEMMWFRVKSHESDQTKMQDGCRQCCYEGDCSGPGVGTIFAMIDVMRWRRRKSSWWWRVVSRFYFFVIRRI